MTNVAAESIKSLVRYAEQFRDSLPHNDVAGRQRVTDNIETAKAAILQAGAAKIEVVPPPHGFHISWENGAYYVSIPNYDGGDVITAEHHAAVIAKHRDDVRDLISDLGLAIENFTRGAFTGWTGKTGSSKISLDDAEDHFSLCMRDMMDAFDSKAADFLLRADDFQIFDRSLRGVLTQDIYNSLEERLDDLGCLALTDEGLEAFREIAKNHISHALSLTLPNMPQDFLSPVEEDPKQTNHLAAKLRYARDTAALDNLADHLIEILDKAADAIDLISGERHALFNLAKCAHSRTAAAESKRKEALDALKPFAAQAPYWPEKTDTDTLTTCDPDGDCCALDFTMGDLRRADLVLKTPADQDVDCSKLKADATS